MSSVSRAERTSVVWNHMELPAMAIANENAAFSRHSIFPGISSPPCAMETLVAEKNAQRRGYRT